ncbi:MAG TPA: O-methyltransferase [Saprospiraceae bacterium]|nr:O-methyltransferase [Saprospiraceae bacterium]
MIDPEIQKYTDSYSNVDDPVLEEVERSTHLHTIAPQMLSGRVQGAFLTFLATLIEAENILELGTFTGFSAICLARGLKKSPTCRLVTFESNGELSFLIKKNLALAGVEDKVESIIGDALQILPSRKETWDMVYIDANKQEYIDYFNLVIDHVRPGGLIITDNVLWSGKVVTDRNDVDANVIHRYNEMIANDPRVKVLMLTIRDGLSIARKL